MLWRGLRIVLMLALCLGTACGLKSSSGDDSESEINPVELAARTIVSGLNERFTDAGVDRTKAKNITAAGYENATAESASQAIIRKAGDTDADDLIELIPKIITGILLACPDQSLTESELIKIINSISSGIVAEVTAVDIDLGRDLKVALIGQSVAALVSNLDGAGISTADAPYFTKQITVLMLQSLYENDYGAEDIFPSVSMAVSAAIASLDESGIATANIPTEAASLTGHVTRNLNTLWLDDSEVASAFGMMSLGSLATLTLAGLTVDEIVDDAIQPITTSIVSRLDDLELSEADSAAALNAFMFNLSEVVFYLQVSGAPRTEFLTTILSTAIEALGDAGFDSSNVQTAINGLYEGIAKATSTLDTTSEADGIEVFHDYLDTLETALVSLNLGVDYDDMSSDAIDSLGDGYEAGGATEAVADACVTSLAGYVEGSDATPFDGWSATIDTPSTLRVYVSE